MRTMRLAVLLLLPLVVGCGRNTSPPNQLPPKPSANQNIQAQTPEPNSLETAVPEDDPQTQFLQVVEDGRAEDAKSLLSKYPELSYSTDATGKSPLMIAMKNGDKKMLKVLSEKPGEAKFWEDDYEVLRDAIYADDLELVRMLLSMGADPNAKNDSQSVLQCAVDVGKRPMIDVLLSKGADIKSGFGSKRDVMRLALDDNDRDLARYLQSRGAPVDAYTAAAMNQVGMLKKLAAKGVNLSACDKEGKSPVLWAAQHEAVDAVEYLIPVSSGSALNAADDSGLTPLDYVVQNKQMPLARKMLARDAKVETLTTACALGDLKRVKALVARYESVTGGFKGGYDTYAMPLECAARGGSVEVMKFLISKGALAEHRDQALSDSFLAAAQEGQVTAMRYLLSMGVDIESGGRWEMSPLYAAAYEGQNRSVEFLLAHGAHIDGLSGHGCFGQDTPLHGAACAGQLKTAELLIAKGANVDAVDPGFNEPPLFSAAEEGHVDVARLLLDRGARINMVSNMRKTALHVAAENGRLQVVSLLISRGAKVNAKDVYNCTPLRLALAHSHTRVANYLKRHGGKDSKPTPDVDYELY